MQKSDDNKIRGGAEKRRLGMMLASASGLILATAMPAYAQSAEASQEPTSVGNGDESEDIIVTGLIGSLQRNLDIKRSSSGIVDAISAEDIGKFPDSNVAAALQRLPGVSISRAGARGEPTGITVRGFGGDFNATLYDGRRISSATGSRQIDFSTVGADFVGELNVLKTPDVSLDSSSIGATVNVKFPKPFDNPGLRIAVSGSGSIQDEEGKVTPTGGVLISNTFADDTIGILAAGIYSRRDTAANRVFVSGWQGGRYAPCQLTANCTEDELEAENRTVVGWYQQQYGLDRIHTQDERIDGRIALQLRPSDNILITIDDNFSQQDIRTNSAGFGVWFNQGALRNVQLDENGTTVDFTQDGTPFDFTAADNHQRLRTNQLGGNVKWELNENLTLEGDGSYAKSWQNPGIDKANIGGDIGYGALLGTTLGVRVNGNSSNSLPEITAYGPNGDSSRFLDQSLIGSHVATSSTARNTDAITQGKFQATWEEDKLRVRIGAQYVHDRFRLQNSSTFVNNFWQAYSGYGPASGSATGVPIPADLITGSFNTKDFIPGYSGFLLPELPVYSAADYQAFLSSLGNPQQGPVPGFNAGAITPGYVFDGNFNLALDNGSIQRITERTWAGFISINHETELAGMPLFINLGAREEISRITSAGLARLPVSIIQTPGDLTALTIVPGAISPISTTSKYSYFLPSIDLALELTPELKVRFDASRTLTRPPLNRLTPVLNVPNSGRVGALTATGGNPTLQPYLADNFDAGVEWYYRPNSYFAANVFAKRVTNFVVAGTNRQTINNVVDPTTNEAAIFTVSQYVNGPSATIKGIELALQHVFGDSGFGFSANATFVDTNKPYDPDDISLSGFAVTGLANSANFVGFYDKNGFQARIAANWRDEYLLQFGQAQNNSAFGAEPTFVNSSFQIDFSTSYEINDQFSVIFEALNLNNETLSTHGRYDNQLLDVYRYGRRFTLGARFRY